MKPMFQPDMARHSSGQSVHAKAFRRAAWNRTALAVAIAAFSTVAAAKDNRPAAPDFSHAPAATQAMLAKAKPVTAKHAMVVSDQHLATDAGAQILKEGGNAIDAAVAVGYALAVTQPCCGNIGGGGFMTIHMQDGQNLFLNFREKAPLKATPNMFLDAQGNVVEGRSTDTYLGVGVPGTVMGLDTALKKYGTMSVAQVIQPRSEERRVGKECRSRWTPEQ